MENQQHTPEPWKKQGLTIWSVNSVGLEVIANTTTANGDEKDAVNARRIVACVNACAGISTEALEALPNGKIARLKKERDEVIVDKMALMMEMDRLRAENEQLRDALQRVWNDCEKSHPEGYAAIRYETFVAARAALSETAQPAER